VTEGERVRRKVWQVGLSCLIFALPVRALAQAADADSTATAGAELLEAGKTAYGEGRFSEALGAFEQSYERTHKPRTLYRIADTADKLGLHARAVAAFEQYLGLVPAADDRPFIESRIDANRRKLEGRPPAAALSPAAAAHAEAPVAATPAPDSVAAPPAAPEQATGTPATSATHDQDLTRAWWVWAGAGSLLVAGIVVVALAVGSSGARSVPEPVKGNVGGAVQTLGAP
jgi:tetratricopeptide (TPR) repeat protein